MTPEELFSGLPGEELIREGLADVEAGRRTPAAFLVAIALPRLRRAGITAEVPPDLQTDTELQLYRLLRQAGGDAYSNYNALLRRLVSFEQALDKRLRMAKSSDPKMNAPDG